MSCAASAAAASDRATQRSESATLSAGIVYCMRGPACSNAAMMSANDLNRVRTTSPVMTLVPMRLHRSRFDCKGKHATEPDNTAERSMTSWSSRTCHDIMELPNAPWYDMAPDHQKVAHYLLREG